MRNSFLAIVTNLATVTLLTACAVAPRVSVETVQGRTYRTDAEMDAEARKTCQTNYGKKNAVFKDLVFGQSMGNPAKSYICTD